MTVLILGCGYLGLQVARLLREIDPGSNVIGTTRSPTRFGEIAEAGAEPRLADLLDPGSISRLPSPDAILHCAAYGRSSPDRPLLAIGGLLGELAERGWAGRFVHVSTTSVYGQSDGTWVDETSRAEPTTTAGQVALTVEVLLAAARPTAIILRMAGLYGPGRVIGREGLLRCEPVSGSPAQWLNLIRIEDAARVAVAAIRHDAPKPLYVACDDRPIRRDEYYSALADVLQVPPPVFTGPTDAATGLGKRIRNRLMREDLAIEPDFPDIASGLRGLSRG